MGDVGGCKFSCFWFWQFRLIVGNGGSWDVWGRHRLVLVEGSEGGLVGTGLFTRCGWGPQVTTSKLEAIQRVEPLRCGTRFADQQILCEAPIELLGYLGDGVHCSSLCCQCVGDGDIMI